MKITRLLDIKKNSHIPDVAKLSGKKEPLRKKLDELIEVIEQSGVDHSLSQSYQEEIAEAFRRSAFKAKAVAPFQALDQDNNLSREELLEGLEKLLSENKIDSKISSSYIRRNAIQKLVMFILAILLIVFGFAMIIMPAPPSFEIFTVFYFNANDGVTIMDLVSLLIIFGGVLLFVLNFNKK
ncbi:hypothetical protein MUK70_02125 [Dyadobacter chenwenxiniae]|uniref:Uncharacterized protein n=1 Tax=Dyadobacter chenwenxiniae TaxID=2906456 RepID=A0A9X1TDZ3_9BACT|nr:hypothetical protein [Dyadobacter chenwenxiniae]MCF0062456.1 hypothetical protein [Dyadobacter chenwenxiniae]UON83796.1 hypothetical protein MUK70_02125 [Dyadobacter chenwenxiniae]